MNTLSKSASSSDTITTLTIGAATSNTSLYPISALTGFGSNNVCGVAITAFDGNSFNFGNTNGYSSGNIQLGFGEYFSAFEVYMNTGDNPLLAYMKLTTNTGTIIEIGSKMGTPFAFSDIRLLRIGFTQDTNGTVVTGLVIDYVPNYTPRTNVELTYVVLGYQVGPGNFMEHASDQHKWQHTIGLQAKFMAAQGGQGSALGDFYTRLVGAFPNQQGLGPFHMQTIGENLISELGTGNQPRTIQSGEVMVLNCSADVYQNGNYIWFDTSISHTLHHDCFAIDDPETISRFQGTFDLTGTLSSVITGLSAYETTQFGVTYFNKSSS